MRAAVNWLVAAFIGLQRAAIDVATAARVSGPWSCSRPRGPLRSRLRRQCRDRSRAAQVQLIETRRPQECGVHAVRWQRRRAWIFGARSRQRWNMFKRGAKPGIFIELAPTGEGEASVRLQRRAQIGKSAGRLREKHDAKARKRRSKAAGSNRQVVASARTNLTGAPGKSRAARAGYCPPANRSRCHHRMVRPSARALDEVAGQLGDLAQLLASQGLGKITHESANGFFAFVISENPRDGALVRPQGDCLCCIPDTIR